MPAGGIIPGLRGQVKIGSTVFPMLQGSTFSMPKNYAIPNVFSADNMFQYLAVEGLQYPTLNLVTLVTGDWFTATFLNSCFTRTSDDVASLGTLDYWDGKAGIQVPACKLNILAIGGSLGDLIRCRMTILGYGTPTTTSSKPATSLQKSSPASFYDLTASGGLDIPTGSNETVFASFDLTLANNLDVCPELNASKYPLAINAGQMTGTLRVVQQAGATRLADNAPVTFSIDPPGAAVAVAFTVENPLCQDPEERTLQFPRQMREYNYALLAESTGLSKIITIA